MLQGMDNIKNLCLFPLYWLFRFSVWLRYRIEIEGLDEIVKANKKGILFLPNHPALIDPVIVYLSLWKKFKPRPLVLEEYYERFSWLFNLAKVLPLPSTETTNKWKRAQIERTERKIAESLEKGDHFLIYPSGQIKRGPEEKIGGASFVHELLQIRPDTTIVLIRTTGLWGSSFSWYPEKASPVMEKMLWQGFKTMLMNALFFTPRRRVKIEMEFAPQDFPRHGEKMQVNKWLEDWYNKYGPEKEALVSFLFWKKKFPEIKEEKKEKIGPVVTSVEKRKEILGYLAKSTNRPESELQPQLRLSNDLGLDSLDIGQLNVFLEERFDVPSISLGQLQTVNDLFIAAEGKKEEVHAPLEEKSRWPHEEGRLNAEYPPGDSIQEVFLASCDRMKGAMACGDRISGVVSYKKLKLAALVLSLKIKEMPGDKIGILLPSSVGAYTTILATLLAGKTPVMLNWTTGFRNLEYAVDLCGIKTILSSYRFLSLADTVDLGKTEEFLVLLEKVRGSISLITKLKGLFLSFFPAKKILKKLKLQTNPEEPAAIIFTSGTEALPKGVPLSHRNLLANQRAARHRVNLKPTDVFYAVLPPFHSFGLSVTGLFPLFMGVKTCYAPDPTKSRAMAKDIEEWKATIFCCAPSFIKALFQVAKEGQLKSLRLVVSGAEKTPKELFDLLFGQGIYVMEGYGISECSPIVTTDIEGEPHKGVGKPISNVELCIIDPATEELLEDGTDGEVCISGPGVFNGYLGIKKDPFITIKGKRWYRSGDRGHLDPDGTLILTGRLKRFVKIGGEMVSLGGLEEDLLKICIQRGWLPEKSEAAQLATAVKDREGEKPQIVLFSVVDLNRDELNRSLKELGHGMIVKISEVRKVEAIPVTATGKVQYRALDDLIKQ